MKLVKYITLFVIMGVCVSWNDPIEKTLARAGNNNLQSCDTLCYHYYFNSELDKQNKTPHMLDEVLVFVRCENQVKCYYYGPSTEFDDSSEMFLPGFTVLLAENTKLTEASVSFCLDSNNKHFYSRQIELGNVNEKSIDLNGYYRWVQPEDEFWKRIRFEGSLDGNKMTLRNTYFGYMNSKVFYLEKYNDVKKKYSRWLISDEDERANNINTAFLD